MTRVISSHETDAQIQTTYAFLTTHISSHTRNARKNNDWPLIQDEFGAVNKMIEKSKMLILTNGFPNFYIKMLAEVEEHVQTASKDRGT